MKKLIYIFNIIIHSEPNQSIELNNVNPEIIKENKIHEHQVIDEVHDKETKPKTNYTNYKSATGLLELETKPEQDAHKPKTSNWIYFLFFICCAIVIVICFVCWIKSKRIYFLCFTGLFAVLIICFVCWIKFFLKNSKENPVVEIYFNQEKRSYRILTWPKENRDLQKSHFYIDCIVYYFFDYLVKIAKEEQTEIGGYNYDKIIRIYESEIKQKADTVFLKKGFYNEEEFYELFFLEEQKINFFLEEQIITYSYFTKDEFKNKKSVIQTINPRITNLKEWEGFFKFFKSRIEQKQQERTKKLQSITNILDFLDEATEFFPKLEIFKNWDPEKP